jgi:peptidoglycan/LPS O-acetylase OafA/YrhL
MRIYDNNCNQNFWSFAIPFWLRRIYRIWPSAILWISLILVASICFNKSGAFGDPIGNFSDWVAAILQVANLHWYHCFQQKGTCGVNTIYWSLSLEEQFYLIYPFMFFYLLRYSRNTLIASLLVIIISQLFIERPPRSLLWELRTDALAWGAVIALTVNQSVCKVLTPNFLKSRIGSLLFTCLLIVLISALGPNRVTSINTGLIALLSGALVFISAQNRDMIWPSGLGRSLLIWIGARSYAIYLIHNFVFWTLREGFLRFYPGKTIETHSWQLGLSALVLTLLLSDLNFRLIEIPLRKRGACIAQNIRQSIEPRLFISRSHAAT